MQLEESLRHVFDVTPNLFDSPPVRRFDIISGKRVKSLNEKKVEKKIYTNLINIKKEAHSSVRPLLKVRFKTINNETALQIKTEAARLKFRIQQHRQFCKQKIKNKFLTDRKRVKFKRGSTLVIFYSNFRQRLKSVR